jgi:PAP2 superfamily C-terminal
LIWMAQEWKNAWQLPAFRRQLGLTLPELAAVLLTFSRFLEWVEQRDGVVLHDPILAYLHPREFTWPIFALVYVGLLLGLALLAPRPARLLLALQAYAIMVLLRMAAMFALPLNPPPGMIPLVDPIVQAFGSGAVLTKDLFFSGHTATLVLLSLAVDDRVFKRVLALGAVLAAVLLAWQHVHYTIDLLSAPFFAWGSFRLAAAWQQRRGLQVS